jgi:hypothetical protein
MGTFPHAENGRHPNCQNCQKRGARPINLPTCSRSPAAPPGAARDAPLRRVHGGAPEASPNARQRPCQARRGGPRPGPEEPGPCCLERARVGGSDRALGSVAGVARGELIYAYCGRSADGVATTSAPRPPRLRSRRAPDAAAAMQSPVRRIPSRKRSWPPPPPHRAAAAPRERPQIRRNSRGKFRQRPGMRRPSQVPRCQPARRMSGNSGIEEAKAYELEAHRIRSGGSCRAGR